MELLPRTSLPCSMVLISCTTSSSEGFLWSVKGCKVVSLTGSPSGSVGGSQMFLYLLFMNLKLFFFVCCCNLEGLKMWGTRLPTEITNTYILIMWDYQLFVTLLSLKSYLELQITVFIIVCYVFKHFPAYSIHFKNTFYLVLFTLKEGEFIWPIKRMQHTLSIKNINILTFKNTKFEEKCFLLDRKV